MIDGEENNSDSYSSKNDSSKSSRYMMIKKTGQIPRISHDHGKKQKKIISSSSNIDSSSDSEQVSIPRRQQYFEYGHDAQRISQEVGEVIKRIDKKTVNDEESNIIFFIL